MASETYFVRLRGKISGPFDFTALQRLVKLGMLSRIHEVSRDKVDWTPATAVPGLLPDAAPRATILPGPQAAAAEEVPYAVKDSADSNDVTTDVPTPAAGNTQSQPFNGPVIACVSCGSVLPAAQLFNDRGRYICPSCYQRLLPSVPPAGQAPANADASPSCHGYGVASLIFGIASLIVPAAVPACLVLLVYSRGMALVFWVILVIGLACATLATIFASVTSRGNRKLKTTDGNGLATAGLVLGIISLSGYAMLLVYWVIVLTAVALKIARHVH